MNNNITTKVGITKAMYNEAKKRGIEVDKEIKEGRVMICENKKGE